MEAEGQREVEAIILAIDLAARQGHVNFIEAKWYYFYSNCLECLAEDRDRRNTQPHAIKVLGLENGALCRNDRTWAAVATDGKNSHAGRLCALLVKLLEYRPVKTVFRSTLALKQIRQVRHVERPAPF